MKTISILGSTGSIGLNVLKIIRKNYFKVVLLSAKQNTKLINRQLNIYKPKYFVIEDYKTFVQIKKNSKIKKQKS